MWLGEERLRGLQGRGFWYIYLWEGWLRFGLPLSALTLLVGTVLDAYRGTATPGEFVGHAEAHFVSSFGGALLWAAYVLYRVDHPSAENDRAAGGAGEAGASPGPGPGGDGVQERRS